MKAARRAAPGGLIHELNRLFGPRASTAPSVLDQHGHDESHHATLPPDIVVHPNSTEEVSRIVALCAQTRTPVIPFGTGTSLEGHVGAPEGGVCIDVTGMNDILQVNIEDLDATVQAGVTRRQLNESLRHHGIFFPIDPGADASIGGMAATRASGTNAVRYGTMRENVLGLTVVLADGSIVRTGGRARKSSAGYDLTRLLVGSEGTLGVITEVTVRLQGIPEAISAAVCSFPSLDAAVRSVIETVQLGIGVARIELLDEVLMEAVNRYSQLDHPVAPTLFYEFHGSPRGVAEQAETAQAIASGHGGTSFAWATKQQDRTRLWRARHDSFYAGLSIRPGAKAFTTDVCVPISRLAECIGDTKEDLEDCPVPVCLVGHAGDGNFHLMFLVDPDAPGEMDAVERVNERMVHRAIAMGGTCTGEHGIGSGKRRFLQLEHGAGVEVMRTIKAALDPHGIMNPGKILPDA